MKKEPGMQIDRPNDLFHALRHNYIISSFFSVPFIILYRTEYQRSHLIRLKFWYYCPTWGLGYKLCTEMTFELFNPQSSVKNDTKSRTPSQNNSEDEP
jgi:hypothetical protein